MNDLERLLHLAVQRGASDLHLVAGSPPQLRVAGLMVPLADVAPLHAAQVRQLCTFTLTLSELERLERERALERSFTLSPAYRVRAHLYTQRDTLAGAFHLVSQEITPFESLALPDKLLLDRIYGLVLVAGPGGSGRSTTLNAMLDKLNREEAWHIATLEDPIEQVHRAEKSLITQRELGRDVTEAAQALRMLLRQDIDVLNAGEIRDFETAEIAIKAALTGHLVFATLHANNAPSTINRLLNMAIETYLITASVNAVVAQRLGRKVCVDCQQAVQLSPEEMRELEVPEDQLTQPVYRGEGCSTCSGSGYKGRVAFFEVLYMSDEIKEAVLMGFSTAELKNEAIRLGMDTLRMVAIKQMLDGVTSPEEVVRNTPPDRR